MPSKKQMDAETRFTDAIRTSLSRIPFTDLNQPLYHFTDKAGLKGILRTRSLWASLATALEDTSEIEYALSRAKRILQCHEVSCNSSFLEEVVPLLDPLTSQTISTLGMKTYVISFRANVNESAHWATYGRSGTGFAIAFGLKSLVIPGILPIPVLYDPLVQDKLLREFVESSAQLFDNLLQECPPAESAALRQRVIQWTALGLWTLAPAFKHPCYEEEKEWRLIVIDFEHVHVVYGKGLSKKVEVRRHNNRDIPYKVLQYDALPIAGLELGAHAPIDENDPCLSKLLHNATGGFVVPITRSQVLAER